MKKISIVIPVYQAEHILTELFKRIHEVMKGVTKHYEIICVEDGSRDKSWDVLKQSALHDPRIKALRFTRNFGQHNALNAGLKYAGGDYVIVMDCDLQDDPKDIPTLIGKVTPDIQMILTKKIRRNQSFFRKLIGVGFYRFISWSTGRIIDDNIGGFSLLTREVVTTYNKITDINKFYLPTLLSMGYPFITVTVKNNPRFEGKSSYTLAKLIRHGVFSLVMSTDAPLRFSVTVGLFFMLCSFLGVLYIVGIMIFSGLRILPGWTSLMTALFFFSGIILFGIGMTGLYIAQILEHVQGRHPYSVRSTIHLKSHVA